MGNSRGPKKEPTALRLLKGNPGRRALPADEPKPPPALKTLKPPVWLPLQGKKEWKRLLPILCKTGVLTEVDVSALAGYCNAWATWIDAIQTLKREGRIQITRNGYAAPTPYVKIERDAQADMLKWSRELGITPSARTNVTATKEPETDDLDDLIAGGKQKGT